MTDSINVFVLNTNQELQSFPLSQSIKLKFSERVEDAQLEQCIALIRNISETGLFNVSEKYNQSIGYIREKFDVESVKLSYEEVTDGFIVTVTPTKPLSPGFEYTLVIDKNLSTEFLSVTKTITKSPSEITVSVSTSFDADISIEIISDPYITTTSNNVRFRVTDNLLQSSYESSIDLKSKSKVALKNGIELNFKSVVYMKGEVFNILSLAAKKLKEDLFVQIKTALTANIKPIETDETFSSVTNQTILDYYKDKDKKAVKATSNPDVVYTGSNKFLIKLPDGITVDDIDMQAITYEISEAFDVYTLESYGLYCQDSAYTVSISIKDNSTLSIQIEEG